MVKPFGVKELLARVEAVLRRSPQRPTDIAEVAIPGGTIDWLRQETRFDDGGRAALAELELSLLRYLVQHAGRAVSRDEILSQRLADRLAPHAAPARSTCTSPGLREKLRDDAGQIRGSC